MRRDDHARERGSQDARPRGTRRWRIATSALAAGALALGVAACGGSSSGGSGKTSGSGGSGGSSSGATVHLTFWSWVPGIAQQVKLFNKSHPKIQVKLVQTPTGAAGTYAKMFAAIKAGTTPDLGQIEFDVLPSFVSSGGLANLAKYGVSSAQSQFSPSAWKLVDFGGGVWAIPQATGPTGLFYNAALFKKYGLAVPKTWAQFAAEAVKVHKAHPSVYMTNFDTDPSWLAMFVWQNNGRWFTAQGNQWKLGFTDSASEQVANCWQKLVSAHDVLTEPSFNAAWYGQLNKGALLTLPTAQWMTTIMSDNVKAGKGKWRIAPMPQWSAGANTYGQYGGSTTAVFKTTKHPQQALQFAEWMNENKQAIQSGVVAGFGWPAAKNGTSVPALSTKYPYFGSEDIYAKFRTSQAHTATGWSYGPDYSTVLTQMGDLFSGLASGSQTLPKILSATQSKQLASLKSAGINATG